MNREQKRRLARKIPGYKNLLKESTDRAFEDLKRVFEEKWESDETVNGGDWEKEENEFWGDEIYND